MKQVVYLAPVEWEGPVQRPHEVARLLGPHCRFLYVNPTASRNLRLSDALRLARVLAPKPRGSEGSGVRTFTFWHLPFIGRAADRFNAFLFGLQADRRLALKPGYTLVITTPSVLALTLIERTRPGRVVYGCMDNYSAFHRGAASARMVSLEEEVLRRCDQVVVSSESLQRRLSGRHASVVLASNGVDMERFAALAERPAPADAPQRRKVLGYCGTLGDWVDFGLLERLSHEFPDATLLLIGPWRAQKGRELLARPNVVWLGERPSQDVPALLGTFDVGLIPFVSDALTEFVNPVKLYEYLAAGLPVVASATAELERHRPHLETAPDAGAFCLAVRAALEPSAASDGVRRQRRAYAANFAWERVLDPYFKALDLRKKELVNA